MSKANKAAPVVAAMPNNNEADDDNNDDVNDPTTTADTDTSTEYELDINRFPDKLRHLLDLGQFPEALWWYPEGDAVAVHKQTFSDQLLIRHFRGNKFASVTRNFNRWGFRRVTEDRETEGVLGYTHDLFRRHDPNFKLLRQMKKEVYVKKEKEKEAPAVDSNNSKKRPKKKAKLSSKKSTKKKKQAIEEEEEEEEISKVAAGHVASSAVFSVPMAANRPSLVSTPAQQQAQHAAATSLQQQQQLVSTGAPDLAALARQLGLQGAAAATNPLPARAATLTGGNGGIDLGALLDQQRLGSATTTNTGLSAGNNSSSLTPLERATLLAQLNNNNNNNNSNNNNNNSNLGGNQNNQTNPLLQHIAMQRQQQLDLQGLTQQLELQGLIHQQQQQQQQLQQQQQQQQQLQQLQQEKEQQQLQQLLLLRQLQQQQQAPVNLTIQQLLGGMSANPPVATSLDEAALRQRLIAAATSARPMNSTTVPNNVARAGNTALRLPGPPSSSNPLSALTASANNAGVTATSSQNNPLAGNTNLARLLLRHSSSEESAASRSPATKGKH